MDIKPTDLKTLLGLLQKYLPNTLVWAFGSRVKFTANTNSDLDLVAFITEKQKMSFSLLKEAFAESNLTFKVDLHNWNDLPDNFKKNIEASYVVLLECEKSDLPSGWKKYKLGEICSKIGSGATPRGGKEAYFETEEYSLIRSQNILDFSFSKNGLAFISSQQANELRNVTIESGDVLLNITGDSVARVCQVPDEILPARVNQHVAIIRGNNKLINQKFLKYYLLEPSFKGYMLGMSSSGATRNALTKVMIENFEIKVPDLTAQTQIASILSSLDDKIELNLQMNQTLEAMAQAIFKEWFVDFKFPKMSELGLEGLKDERIFDGQNKEKNEILQSTNPKNHNSDNGLPKGWRMGKLGEEFNITMGQSPKGETLNQENEGMIFYQGRTDFGFRFPSNRIYTTEPNRIANKLDTLVCVRAPVGDINMAIEKCCIGRGLSAVMHKSNAYSYTYYSMNNIEPIFKGFESEGTVFGSLNKNNFENIEVVVPSKELIKEFEKVVNPIDEKILNNSFQIQSLTQTRDTLLPKLMNGQIKVSELGLERFQDDRISENKQILQSINPKNPNSDK